MNSFSATGIATAAIFIAGCSSSAPPVAEPMIEDVSFKQTLLRDAVPYLSKQSGANVELTEEVNQILDLYVDLEMGEPHKLSDVLNAITAFIEHEHHVRLEVVRKSPREFLIVKSAQQPAQTVPSPSPAAAR